MKRLLLFSLVSLLVLLAAGCGGSSKKAVPATAVALVGSQPITKAEFNGLLNQARTTYKSQKRAFPKAGSAQMKQLQDQAMTYLVQRNEFEQKAKDLGVEVTPAKVTARLAQIKKQYFGGSEKRYSAQLKAQGMTEAQVEDSIRSQLLNEAIFNKVTADVKVADKDVSNYYNEHKSQYGTPESRVVRHILVKPTQKALADQLYAQLKAGGDFAALAKKYSKDPGSAAQGGKLTISKGQTVPPFDKAAFSLKTNEISKPVKTQYGWHIIQPLSAITKAKQTPLKDVTTSIRQQLLQQKKTEKMTQWVNDTKKSFCKGQLSFQVGFQPATDPCAVSTTSSATATTQ
jgi:foldase protein PrsA